MTLDDKIETIQKYQRCLIQEGENTDWLRYEYLDYLTGLYQKEIAFQYCSERLCKAVYLEIEQQYDWIVSRYDFYEEDSCVKFPRMREKS